MKTSSNLESNRLRIADILRTTPATTHINFRTDDDRLVDIPLAQADFTARQYPLWVVEDGGYPVESFSVAAAHELPVLSIPPRPSEQAAAAETQSALPDVGATAAGSDVMSAPLPVAELPTTPTAPIPAPVAAKKTTAKKTTHK